MASQLIIEILYLNDPSKKFLVRGWLAVSDGLRWNFAYLECDCSYWVGSQSAYAGNQGAGAASVNGLPINYFNRLSPFTSTHFCGFHVSGSNQ